MILQGLLSKEMELENKPGWSLAVTAGNIMGDGVP